MKRISGNLRRALLVAALALAHPQANAAVGFTVSPSSVDNLYRGKIVLTITNLNVGETVTVERYADLNGNGILDPGEPLVLSFQVTDGQVPLIAGVRNRDVPGDEDGLTNGQIRVELFFRWVDTAVFSAALKSIFKVTGTASGSALQPFSVSQHAYPQGLTGRVTAALTGLPLTNTLVLLDSAVSTAGSVSVSQTDTNGFYTFYAVPDDYFVIILKDGFVGGQTAPVTVPCGGFVTNNLTASNGLFTISGKVSDSASGAGLPGIFVSGNSTSLFTGGFTDTNGNYTFHVAPGQWKLKPDAPGLAQIGHVAFAHRTSVTVSLVNVSNINFVVPKATALIHGALHDSQSNAVSGLPIFGQDAATVQHEGRARSYVSFVTNATYSLGVIGGSWAIAPRTDDVAFRGYIGSSANVNITDGQAMTLDLVVTRTNFPSLSHPVRITSSQVQLQLTGLAGENYTLQAGTNLDTVHWASLLTSNAPCATFEMTDTQATNGPRFYRAFVAP